MVFLSELILFTVFAHFYAAGSLDNGVIGIPEVDCMEDRVKLTFNTQKPFTGRIFVKGMVDKSQCVNSFDGNSKKSVQFEMTNGQCNMRRSRKLGPEHKGVEQSITVIISFHNTFITKVDKAFRCTCFYMEADKVVTSRFDVSMLPTTDLIDTARMPLCTYTVRRGSVNGAIVSYATVGELVYHVWQCESDMFSMLVHSCFVDDGNGKDKKPLLDEYGCAIESSIVPDLTYNEANNLAFSEVNVFKFADKVTTYFQCAVSTCMRSEGMCSGKTPPRCGGTRVKEQEDEEVYSTPHHRLRRHLIAPFSTKRMSNRSQLFDDQHTMDLAAEKIIVLDLEERNSGNEMEKSEQMEIMNDIPSQRSLFVEPNDRICLNFTTAALFSAIIGFSVLIILAAIWLFILRRQHILKTFRK